MSITSYAFRWIQQYTYVSLVMYHISYLALESKKKFMRLCLWASWKNTMLIENRTSSRIVLGQVTAASGLVQEFRIVLLQKKGILWARSIQVCTVFPPEFRALNVFNFSTVWPIQNAFVGQKKIVELTTETTTRHM